jgi:pyruvate dehydrogenase E2 component (dihydrolipoamide acetyltransferase)
MATAVEMPKLSDTMDEGVLVSWEFDEGDSVSEGDVIAQIETDKATMDLEAYDAGVLLKRLVGEGDSIPIGQLIAVIGEEGEDISDILEQYDQGADSEAAEEAGDDTETEEEAGDTEEVPADKETPEADGTEPARSTAPSGDVKDGTNGRIKASPLARRMAGEEQLDLAAVEGSGPGGRIIKRDIEAALDERQKAPAGGREARPVEPIPEEAHESEPISQMRKTIARRLADSKFSAPHFYLTIDIDMARTVEVRERLNGLAEAQDRPKISYNDLITKASAVALREHPDVNASYLADEGEIRRYNHVHVAVAVAIDEGLVTPVIRHADRKGLAQIAEETQELAAAARERTLEPSDWEGSTFTTSNLGMFGIEEFTAIINPPNACILAIGGIRDEPVVEDGAVVPGKRMKVTLSCDHRVVDGATGARFLNTLQQYLEEPTNMLL